jgi:hypothetical protein
LPQCSARNELLLAGDEAKDARVILAIADQAVPKKADARGFGEDV